MLCCGSTADVLPEGKDVIEDAGGPEGKQASPAAEWAKEKVGSHKYLPPKAEAMDEGFVEEGLIPQKYCWLSCICSCFAMFTDMGGLTFPAFWDAHLGGPGFTDVSQDELCSTAEAVLIKLLAPEIKELVDNGVTEEDAQERWSIAMGIVMLRNMTQAKGDNADITLHNALTGSPDEACPVDAERWSGCVWKPDLFAEEGGDKLNGDAYTKEQLEKILGRTVEADEIVCEEEEEEE